MLDSGAFWEGIPGTWWLPMSTATLGEWMEEVKDAGSIPEEKGERGSQGAGSMANWLE